MSSNTHTHLDLARSLDNKLNGTQDENLSRLKRIISILSDNTLSAEARQSQGQTVLDLLGLERNSLGVNDLIKVVKIALRLLIISGLDFNQGDQVKAKMIRGTAYGFYTWTKEHDGDAMIILAGKLGMAKLDPILYIFTKVK